VTRRLSAAPKGPWWIDPANFATFVILPVFVISASLGGPLMTDQFESFNFLTRQMITLGIVAICLFAIGAKLGAVVTSRSANRGTFFHPHLFDQFLVLLLAVALGAYFLLLGGLLLEPTMVVSMLRGEGNSFVARGYVTNLFGITSLTNVTPLLCSMCSVRYVTRGAFFPSRATTFLALLLAPMIFIHALVGSERVVLIENAVGFMLPLFSFAPAIRRLAVYAPPAGIIAVVTLFTWGEYIRSWPFYQDKYDSFAQFAGLRLLAYLAVAANTGAGMISTLPPVGYPLITARWFERLQLVDVDNMKSSYLAEYGNREFTNPSGMYAPIIDFGLTIGILYLFLFGAILGCLYGFYRRRHPVGLLAFPIFYVGLADWTQLWYWGQPAFIPQIMFLVAAIAMTVRRPVMATAQSRY
jgi:hypothetical protein